MYLNAVKYVFYVMLLDMVRCRSLPPSYTPVWCVSWCSPWSLSLSAPERVPVPQLKFNYQIQKWLHQVSTACFPQKLPWLDRTTIWIARTLFILQQFECLSVQNIRLIQLFYFSRQKRQRNTTEWYSAPLNFHGWCWRWLDSIVPGCSPGNWTRVGYI